MVDRAGAAEHHLARRKEPLRNAFQAHYSKRYTYEDLREEALNPRQKSLFDEEEPEPSCFCD